MKQNTFDDKKNGMLKKHRKNKFWKKAVALLSCVTVFCTSYTMILPAMTMSEETFCGQEEGENHTHTLQCYSNPNADLENEANWTATIPSLTGNWNEDAVAVADSQLGYHESAANYHVSDNNEKKGYTRYGAWMNDPYADWNTDFVLFCLHYANVDANALSLSNDISTWTSNGAFVSKDSYAPNAGDLIVLDENNDGAADHAAIITEANGNAIRIVEGDLSDAVTQANYDTTDARVIGYIRMPQNPAMQTVAETAEETSAPEATAAPEETAQPEEASAPAETAEPEAAVSAQPTSTPEAAEATAEPQETAEPETTATPEATSTPEATDVPSVKTTAEAKGSAKKWFARLFSGVLKAPAKNNNDRTNLANYITSVTAEKKNGSQWEDATEFNAGDTARFTIEYTVKDNQLVKGDVLTYQLDKEHIKFTSETSGEVQRDGLKIGTYKITKDGLITIHIDDDKDVSKAFSGTITFSGNIANDQSSEGATVNFGTNGSFKINPTPESDNTDLSIVKKGEYKNGVLYYAVTISTIHGTDSSIQMYDKIFSGLKPGYSFGKPVVKKNGIVDGNYEWTKDNDGKYILNQELPALNANENYTIEYTVTPNQSDEDHGLVVEEGGSEKVGNQATARTQKHFESSWKQVEIRNKRIEKKGETQDSSKTILWTLTINNKDRSNIFSHHYKDTMKNITDNSEVPLPEKVNVQVTNPASDHLYTATVNKEKGTENGTIEFPSDLPANALEYKITYQTKYSDVKIPDGKDSATVENTFNEDKSEAKASVTISHGSFGVSKYSENDDVKVQEGSTTLLTWSARISYPDTLNNSKDLEKLTYTDTMSMKHGNQGKDGLHYTTPELLRQMTVWDDAETFKYGVDYQIYDNQGNSIADLPEDTHLSAFRIEFINPRYVIPKKSDISLRYQSIADFRNQNVGEKWSAVNKGEIPDHSHEANFDHTIQGTLNKQSSAVDRFAIGNGTSYKDDDVVVNYDDQYVYYRVLITVPGQHDTLQLIDTFPSGLTFDEEYGLKVKKHGDDYYEPDLDPNPVTNCIQLKSLPDGSTEYQFSVYNQSSTYSFNAGDVIVLYYRAKIEDNDFWSQNKDLNKTYFNRIQMGNLSDISETIVKKEEKVLSKNAIVRKNGSGDSRSYTAAYSLVVNPYGKDLDPNKNSLTLTDQLSIDKPDSEAIFDPESLCVYAYDNTKEDKTGEPLNANRYSATYDSASHKITVTIPDALALVIKYNYTLQVGSNDTIVNNNAALSGVAGGSTSNSNTLKTTDSGATAYRKVVKICKVDSDNIKIKLQGVTFKLEEFAPDNGTWKSVNTKTQLVTNENGEISLNEIQEDLKDDTVYRLTETDVGKENAEKGYELSDQSYYFVWKSKAHLKDDNNKYFSELPNTQTLTNTFHITSSQIQFMNYSGTIYVPNVKHALTVNKVWVDSNGKDIVNPQKTATVRLMRSFHEQVNVILNIKDLKNSNGDGYTNYTLTAKVYKNDPNARIIIFGWHRDQKYGSLYLADTGKELDWIQTDPNSPWEIYPYYNVGSIDSDLTIDLNASIEWDKPGQLSVKVTGSDDITSSLKSETAKDASGNEIAPVVLSNENGWSYTWKNLPAVDANGETYYYYVVEDEVSGYTTSYDNNEGNEHGTITVTNKKDATQDYELPDTGGTGTAMIYVAGGVLVAVAVVMLVMQKRKKS